MEKVNGYYEKVGPSTYQFWGGPDLEWEIRKIPCVEIVYRLTGVSPRYLVIIDPQGDVLTALLRIQRLIMTTKSDAKVASTYLEKISQNTYWFWGEKNIADLIKNVPGVSTVFVLENNHGKYEITLDPRYDPKWVLNFIKDLSSEVEKEERKKWVPEVKKKEWSNFENYLFSDILADIRLKAEKIWLMYGFEFGYEPIKLQQYVFGLGEGLSYILLGNGFMYDIREKTVKNPWGNSISINDLKELYGHLLVLEFALGHRVDVTY